ncbi:hypothetical protein GE09DRAFT_340753 [Coniochaeta sp. 2T2.1]|nr:hypothetical protein GE09DRAFT_340753 [Coniochaeta sp. 2T2.1]
MEATQNSFYTKHDPETLVVVAYALSGTGCAVGLIQMPLLALCGGRRHRNTALRVISFVLFAAQTIAAGFSIKYGFNNLSQGCRIFNATKKCAIAALFLGLIYSLAMAIARCLSIPLADDDETDDDGDTDDGNDHPMSGYKHTNPRHNSSPPS